MSRNFPNQWASDRRAVLRGMMLAILLLAVPAVHAADYAGSDTCRGCHEAEYAAWRGSHHDLAMQVANPQSVLGDFSDTLFEHRGVSTRFFRRDGRFMVETQGADGEQHEYEVAYAFGVVPLQQYLIGFPDGRYQALTVAWDSRPPEQGGQRWFHLYPNEDIPPGDELHWTAPAHNWNFACAECHSTRLRKNYDPVADTYRTDWAEINVACEACHGPGGPHVAAAQAASSGTVAGYPADHGLLVDLAGPGEWNLPAGSDTASLIKPPQGAAEIEACGRCHSRRSQLSEDYVHGRPLADTHRLQLLTDGYYHPDGQILDEVYVYGSFRQSRMHAAGVTCSDCHEPHSLTLKAEGNAVCTTCHARSTYDSPEHHHHPVNSPGAQCVECHMPDRTYMVVDPRRDHSMRIPRPDLSLALGVPDACSECHVGRSPKWSVNALDVWYGKDRNPGHQRYARALDAARVGGAGAAEALAALAQDESAPVMARATALQELAGYLGPESLPAVQAGLSSADPLMRRAAVEALQSVELGARWKLVSPLLDDPVRSVRLEVAGVLSDVRPQSIEDPALRQALEQVFAEYEAAEQLNADRVEHWVNLAGFRFRQGQVEQAEKDFAQARRRDAGFVPAYINQADIYRALGREDDGERILRQGLKAAPDAAAIHHALGLTLIRTGRQEEALQLLAQAHRLGADNPRLGYVYGVALESAGRRTEAIEVWEAVVKRHPNDQAVLNVLAMTLYQAGERNRALVHAEHLAALSPNDPVRQKVVDMMRQEIRGRQ